MTAQQLLAELQAAGVELAAEGPKLLVRGRVPERLRPLLKVLHTGVRAALTGRAWYGASDKPSPVIGVNQLIPEDVSRLCVEGDGTAGGKWDRIHPEARIDHPELFAGGVLQAAV